VSVPVEEKGMTDDTMLLLLFDVVNDDDGAAVATEGGIMIGWG